MPGWPGSAGSFRGADKALEPSTRHENVAAALRLKWNEAGRGRYRVRKSTTGILPDFERHYRVSPQFFAMAGKDLQQAFKWLKCLR